MVFISCVNCLQCTASTDIESLMGGPCVIRINDSDTKGIASSGCNAMQAKKERPNYMSRWVIVYILEFSNCLAC